MSVTSIRLQNDLEAPLDKLAKKTSRSKNWIINEALKQYLVQQAEDEKRWQMTLEALESASAGNIVDGEKVHAWLKTWGTDNEQESPDK